MGGGDDERHNEIGEISSLRSSSSSKWAELAPELLANVVRRVQSRRHEERSEARRVVAMAGVCKWWRQHILSLSREDDKRDLVEFPWQLLHPPHQKQQQHVHCLLKRRGSLFMLFQGEQQQDQQRLFLLAARRRWRPSGFSYLIGLDPTNAPGLVLGKLRSNFWASQFVLWHQQGQQTPVVSLRFLEHVVNGIRQRRIWCALPPPPCTTGNGLLCVLDKVKRKKVCRGSSCMLLSSCTSTPRVGAAKGTTCTTPRLMTTSCAASVFNTKDPLELRSKIPAWDAQQQCWSLDFKGRATMPSMHNFQLVLAEQQQQQQSIILQLGKIDKSSYTMDFCYPLSAFQAFAICLSSFATSAGLEP